MKHGTSWFVWWYTQLARAIERLKGNVLGNSCYRRACSKLSVYQAISVCVGLWLCEYWVGSIV